MVDIRYPNIIIHCVSILVSVFSFVNFLFSFLVIQFDGSHHRFSGFICLLFFQRHEVKHRYRRTT